MLQLEFHHPCFVRCDGRAFDANGIFLDGFCCVEGDLVVGLVSVWQAEIVVFKVDVEVGLDEFVFDVFPDDACHLIPVELDDGVLDFDLVGRRHLSSLGGAVDRFWGETAGIGAVWGLQSG